MNSSKVKQYYEEVYDYESWTPPPSFYSRFLELLDCKPPGKLLDIACGVGTLLKEAEKKGLETYGVDISGKAVEIARQRVKGEIKVADVNQGLDYPDKFFDYITVLGSLEHFENQQEVVREIVRIAKNSAKICIYVPNRDYILHKFGYETDKQPYFNRYSLKGWIRLLESNGLQIQKVLKDNHHLKNLHAAGKGLKRLGKIILKILLIILKILFRPFVPFLPLGLSYSFIFIYTRGQT